MANWDHLSNIGTHPVLDPDPRVSLPAKIEAARRNLDRQQAVLDELEQQWLEFNGGLRPGIYYITPTGTYALRSVLDEATIASRVTEATPTIYFFVEG